MDMAIELIRLAAKNKIRKSVIRSTVIALCKNPAEYLEDENLMLLGGKMSIEEELDNKKVLMWGNSLIHG